MQDECSIQSYHELLATDYFGQRQAMVLSVFMEYGPALTGAEAAKHMDNAFGKTAAKSETVLNRISELTHLGILKKAGKTVSPVTGKMVNVWEWTGKTVPEEVNPQDEKIKIVLNVREAEEILAYLDSHSSAAAEINRALTRIKLK